MEWEGVYNYVVLAFLVVAVIFFVYILVIVPSNIQTQDTTNFENTRAIFLSRYCTNLKYGNYTIEKVEGTMYNFKCFNVISSNVITSTYGRYTYEKRGIEYIFYVEQIQK